MKLSHWAKQQGITYPTAWKWFKNGTLPVKHTQTSTGTILVYPEENIQITTKNVAIYARVSSHDQKEDLNRQVDRLKDYCAANGYNISGEYKEIASGMNSNRVKLNKILLDKNIQYILVEHKDRLSRFGFELIKSSLLANNRHIIVVNDTENKMDIVQDFIDIVTSMCARVYGKRGATNRAVRAVKASEIFLEGDDVSN